MELGADLVKLCGLSEMITVWDAPRLRQVQRQYPLSMHLFRAIDEMGCRSRTAQGLAQVLTSVERLSENPNQRLYLLVVDRRCVGILKVGVKKLFIRTASAQLLEINPMCVLDFYIHESEQRSGYGRILVDHMLQSERVTPDRLGYDRPSPKLIGFLRKHFHLVDFVPQSNNFVVFNVYFTGGWCGSSGTQPSGGSVGSSSPPGAAPSPMHTVPQPTGSLLSQHPLPRGSGQAAPYAYSSDMANRLQPPPHQSVYSSTPPHSAAGGGAPSSLLFPAIGGPRGATAAISSLHSDELLRIAAGPRCAATPSAGSQSVLARSAGSTRGPRQDQSPTRSGCGYNIITLADTTDSPPPAPSSSQPPQPTAQQHGASFYQRGHGGGGGGAMPSMAGMRHAPGASASSSLRGRPSGAAGIVAM